MAEFCAEFHGDRKHVLIIKWKLFRRNTHFSGQSFLVKKRDTMSKISQLCVLID